MIITQCDTANTRLYESKKGKQFRRGEQTGSEKCDASPIEDNACTLPIYQELAKRKTGTLHPEKAANTKVTELRDNTFGFRSYR
jgi:hypothetical protein